MTVWQHHITRWMNNDNGWPWPGMCHIIQMVTIHVVVTVLIIPGEQCISPTPLLFSHEKQGFPLPTWQPMMDKQWPGMSTDVPHCLGGDNACHYHCPHYYRWAAPIFFFISDGGATSCWQCGNHTTQDKWWATTMTNDCTTTIIIAVIIIVSPSIPPLPFPTQLTSHHHQTKDSGHSHVTPPQWQSAMTTTDHDHNNDMTRWPCNNHSMTTSHTDHLLHHYCFALIFLLSY